MASPAPAADWEASKENFQPLKAGRKGAALRPREQTTQDLKAAATEERRRAFWEELAGYEGDDPLEVWLRFIKWTQETFSAGGHKAELLPLLERCTRELQADGRYAADIRYLRVWIQYADCLPDPGDVFAFLKENDIGQEHALYYIAFATYLEARGGYAKADAAYQQGINRLAAPVERLRAKFGEFQQRMARRIQRKAAEQLAGGEAAEPDHPERRSLGLLGGRSGGSARGGTAGRPAGGGLLGGGAGLLGKRKAGAGGAQQENVAGGSGLDIFCDEEFAGEGGGGAAPAASVPAALFQPGRSAAAPWTKLGGFEAGRKENVQRASVWAGQRMKQSAAHSAPAAPALEIFVDPELQDAEEQQATGASADAPKPTLRQRLDTGGQGGGGLPEEAIIQDPLQRHKAQASGPVLGGVPGSHAAAPEAKRRREEAMAFSEAALVGRDGEELSFEEVRASRWLEQKRRQEEEEAAAAAGREEDDMELEGQTVAIMAGVGARAGGEAHGSQQAAAAEMQQAAVPSLGAAASPAGAAEGGMAEPASSAFGSPVFVEEAVQQPAAEEQLAATQEADSPGLPAQAAGEAAAPAPAEQGQQQHLALPTPFEQPAEVLPAGYEPTMTISTKDAFAAINQMFGGALPADAHPAELFGAPAAGTGPAPAAGSAAGSGSSGAGSGSGFAAGLEPTMTIATRDAFAALNRMFKGSLPLEHAYMPPNPYADPTITLGLARSGAFGGSGGGSGGGGGYEPTMTISTKAAFDAINQMFKGALPGEHGALPPTSRGPPAGYEPTMTISTKAAFEAINQMFGGGPGSAAAAGAGAAAAASQQQQGGFRVPEPRPPRARPAAAVPAAAAAPADSPGGGFCIREDTQFVSVPLGEAEDAGSQGSPGIPAAGLALGGSGDGGFMIREDTQFITVPAGIDEEEEGGEEAGGGAAAAARGMPGGGLGGGDGGFSIREDTLFITVPAHPASDDGEQEEDEEGGQAAGVGRYQQAAVQQQPAGGLGGGFTIREDTLFLRGGGSDASPSPGGAAASPCASSEAGGSTGDLLAADLHAVAAEEAAAGSPSHSAAAVQVNKWGFAPGADDTLALNLALGGGDGGDTEALLLGVDSMAAASNAGAAALAAGMGHAAAPGDTEDLALQMGMSGLQLSDCKENLPVVAGAAGGSGSGPFGRRLADPAVAAAALQPLGSCRAAELGVEMEADEAAEAALREAAFTAAEAAAEGERGAELAMQDSFAVWADGEDEDCSPPLMGSPAGSAADLALADAAPQLPGSSPMPGVGQAAAAAAAEAGFVTPVQAGQERAAVDPFSPAFRGRMLACLDPAVHEWPGVYCLSAEEEATADAAFKAAGRSAAALEELQLGGLEFAISGCIGEGAYARVFQGVDGDCADVALKREAPPCPWEWYICKALASRVPAPARHRFIDPTSLLLGGRSSVLVSPLGPHGSLQDLVNAYLARGQVPPECLAMHLAADLLRTMQHLHAARIVHTDIKPDNLLVSLGCHGQSGDENAGPTLGLQLIDFGRSVDLELLPAGALLQGDSGTDAFRCVEMREGGPWVWQADAYGAAASVAALLWGRYLEVERVRDSATGAVCLRPVQPFKRQWAGELWGAFFQRLLNHADPSCPPAVDDLVAGFEAHLSGSREAAQRLSKELAAAAAMLPRRC